MKLTFYPLVNVTYKFVPSQKNVTIHVHEHEQVNNKSHDPAVNPEAGSQQT